MMHKFTCACAYSCDGYQPVYCSYVSDNPLYDLDDEEIK